MLPFATLSTMLSLFGLVFPSAYAEENTVVIKLSAEPDPPRIEIDGKIFTSVSFTPVKGKKNTWDQTGILVESGTESSKRVKNKGSFTISLGKGMGDRTCHLERETDEIGPYAVVLRNNASYLSTYGGDKVRVVCGETEPGAGGDEKSTCTPW